MGMNRKNEYDLEEVEKAFRQYLPIWIDEAIKFLVQVKRNGVNSPFVLLYRRPFFDPDMLLHQIMREELEQIQQIVTRRVERGDQPNIPCNNDKFSFITFVESLHFLKATGHKMIGSPYLLKDYSRLKNGRGWIWNTLSPEALDKNLRVFFENLPKAYGEFVSSNFPELAKRVPLFNGKSLVIVLYDAKETYANFEDSPRIKLFYLNDQGSDSTRIEVYNKESEEIPQGLSFENLGNEIRIRGELYRIVGGSISVLDFIYDDLPMLGYIYKELRDNLKQHFKSLRET
jgi:hypothetical protein